MNKKVKVVITILMLIIFSLTMSYYNITLAKVNIDDINASATVSGESEIKNMSSTLYSAITSVGVAVSVVALAAIGIKYMLGSAEEKAEYKKSMMPYLIGALLVFGASGIAKAVVAIAK